jgi:hypothetical protein
MIYTNHCVIKGINMGRRKNNLEEYEHLAPEELYAHVRKNISIPKYMDAFLFEHKISLSKLVQNAIITRMNQEQKQNMRKEIKNEIEEKTIRKKIREKKKDNPNFEHELQRARYLLSAYFNAFDAQQGEIAEQKKQLIFSDFPEMYVDVIKFEQWYKKNIESYTMLKQQFENPVERLITIKKKYFS